MNYTVAVSVNECEEATDDSSGVFVRVGETVLRIGVVNEVPSIDASEEFSPEEIAEINAMSEAYSRGELETISLEDYCAKRGL